MCRIAIYVVTVTFIKIIIKNMLQSNIYVNKVTFLNKYHRHKKNLVINIIP